MHILFVCEGNVGRSQMAEELFNMYSKLNKGMSAGTNGKKYNNRKLKEFAPLVVSSLKEKGIDVSEKIPKQLTQTMAQSADKIVWITDKDKLPDYLVNSDNVLFWNIPDAVNKDYQFHMRICNEIEKHIQNLVQKIG
jgi:protein-tyrosine-phosphatase